LEDSFTQFAVEDDVFSPEFLQNDLLVIQCLHSGTPTPTLPDDVQDYLKARSTKIIFIDKSEGKVIYLKDHILPAVKDCIRLGSSMKTI
jgi:hypothetical protein